MGKTMKILGLILIGIFLFDIGFLAGRYIFKRDNTKEQINVNKNVEDVLDPREKMNENILSEQAELIFRTHYLECGHLVEIATTAVSDKGKTKEQVEDGYPDWKIIDFASKRVVLYKEEIGICNNHYLVKEYEGKIVIFYRSTNKIKNVLDINLGLLSETDQKLFKDGIKLDSNEELAALIEDYTS